jgi:predicted branched-subunit amino acid permease
MMTKGTNKAEIWKSFAHGVVTVSPLMLGVIPFGMICGANAVEAGLGTGEAVLMSVVVFAGASQLAVTQLMANDASWVVILLTGIVINLRMLMYSASLSGYLGNESTVGKLGIAYLLTDQAYATSLHAYQSDTSGSLHRLMCYMGIGGCMWLSFIISCAVGAALGAVIPASWDLGFSVPLTFLAMLMSSLRKPELRRAALCGSLGAIACQGLPYNLGMLLGAVTGIAGGFFLNTRQEVRV